MNFKKKMTNVYKQQVDDLEMLVPNFKIASAIITLMNLLHICIL